MEVVVVAEVAHCCKSTIENERQADEFSCGGDDESMLFLVDLLCGCRGGRGEDGRGGDLEIESSLELLMLSELLLLMATAKANVLRLELSGLFDIPPP